MWFRRATAKVMLVAALAVAAVLASPLAASAEDPVDLDGAYVLDTVGAIDGEEARVIDAIDELYATARIQLFVVYVDNFTGSTNWANDTAILNGLGQNDILLAVAIDQRNYETSIDTGFPLSDAQVSDVELNAIEPRLREDAWADAAVAAAEGLQAAAVGTGTPVGPDDSSEPGGTGGGIGDGTADAASGIPLLPIVGGVVVVGLGVFVYSRIRRRSGDQAAPGGPGQLGQSGQSGQLNHQQLDQRAGSLLVQLDDSIKTSEQELGFAIAQFGAEPTAPFVAALATAKQRVSDAFAIKQRLDDDQPESADERRTMTTQIVELCESADAELDSHADAFEALRELERTAPEAITETAAQLETARAAVAAASGALDRLTATYTAAAVAPIATNIAQAEKLLEFAQSARANAETSFAAGKASDAAVAIRAAQASIGQAVELSAAIDARAESLAEASTALDALVAETRSDLAAAKALPQDGDTTLLITAITAATTALDEATRNTADPIASLTALETANAALDTVFAEVRDEQTKVAKAKIQLDATITAARSQLQSATQFITTRRGGIGEGARTRLSEAERRLAQAEALAQSDPIAALAEGQRARELAQGAFALAEADVEGYVTQQGSAAQDGGRSGSWSAGNQGANLGGLLGGIVGGSFGGSSRISSRSAGGRTSRTGRF
jgi:hypothetical protein